MDKGFSLFSENLFLVEIWNRREGTLVLGSGNLDVGLSSSFIWLGWGDSGAMLCIITILQLTHLMLTKEVFHAPGFLNAVNSISSNRSIATLRSP